MEKTKLGANAFLYPMPMTLIGARVGQRDNFLAAAWVSRVNYTPPLIAVALGKTHFTNPGIEANKAFSVNIPGRALLEKTDYCGMVSGKAIDKSALFKVFRGTLSGAPMISECPVCMECRLVQSVELAADTLFIGEIVETYCEERYMTDGMPDVKKIAPFVLTMPDKGYWAVGEYLGKAWGVGEGLGKK